MDKDNQKTLVPKLRFPEFQDAGEWEETRLGNIVDVLQGFGFPEKYQGKKNGKYPFYKVSDISNALASGSHFIEKSANYIDDDDLLYLKAKTIPRYTTIFAKIGEAIRSNRRAITSKECVIDNNTAGVKAKEGKAKDLFAFYLFSKVNLIDHSGGVVPSVNKTTMENISITCPQLPEQQKIADCLSSIDGLITAQGRKIESLKAHKKGLMQQLFPAEGETIPKLRFPEFRDAGEWGERKLGEVCGAIVKSCVWADQAAARSWRSPFTNLTPRMISARWFDPSSFLHFSWAHWHSLKTMAIAVLRDRQPLVR